MLSSSAAAHRYFCRKISEMNSHRFNRNHTLTDYIRLDTRRCIACWKCVNSCPENVMDKVDLPWHKHAIIKNPATCIGCLKCSKLCETGAISSRKSSQGNVGKHYTPFAKMVYISLLLSTMALIFTGFAIQFRYHMGNHGYIEVNDTFIGMGYHTWSLMHKTISVIFAVTVTVHIYLRRKFLKHNRKTAIILILTITALTGFFAWCCSFSESMELVRKALIEIHDKITLILSLVMIVHLLRHDHIIWPWR